jgi:hypothetical protein
LLTPARGFQQSKAITEAYRAELRLRRNPKRLERRLLYLAIMVASQNALSVDNVLGQRPELKALPNLARAIRTYAAAWKKRVPLLPPIRPPD